MAGLKAEFLRHEYTWSKQSIGGTIGLGVTSSSTPKEKIQLREMEKMASMAEPDSDTGMDVELLMYSMEAGFVKLVVKPVPAGEDQRKNKKVYLYQCKDKTIADPSVYCIPRGSWESTEQTFLPPVILSEEWDPCRTILENYHLTDRLPELFRSVFWCVFRGGNNLAFVVPWKREDYADKSRKIMYAIHCLLPEGLRKNAGYASCGCGMNRCSSFYFTGDQPDSDYFDLSSLQYSGGSRLMDGLDEFFYRTLASIYCEREDLYYQYMEMVEALCKDRAINKNMLREVQWLFLQFSMQNAIDIPSHDKVMDLFPQLFYRGGDSGKLSKITDSLMQYYHGEKWEWDEYEKYLDILVHGITRKGENRTIQEMDWSLLRLYQRDPGKVSDYLDHLRKTRKVTYTRLMTRNVREEGSISGIYNRAAMEDLTELESYIEGMDPDSMTEEAKESWMLRGIEVLNEDVFQVDNFETVTRIARYIHWEKPWMEVSEGFLRQLKDRCRDLSDSHLQAACRIEEIYEELAGNVEDTELKQERKRRKKQLLVQVPEEESTKERTPEKEGEPMLPQKKETGNELYRTLEEEDSREKFLSFLVRGIPYSFLTACILYLLRYALLNGHWKISIGVGGMWLIVMLNYASERIERRKKDGYRFWQALGLCLIEGYIIKTIAWMILPQKFRVYFFLILGLVTVAIQVILVLLLLKKREEEEEI
ncbi:MAG: hypothetical protein IKX76_01380 [Eubacterium sp.]|nr:hypothetical protein [Eubacterium sp.]